MDVDAINKKRSMRKKNLRCSPMSISFSASLPSDAHAIFADTVCAVKYSDDPFEDLRASIVEMIREVGVRDWKEMEELVYCFVVLNSSDQIHGFIEDAFMSLCSCF